MKKKILLSILVLAMLFVVTGCGKSNNGNSNKKSGENLIKITEADKGYVTTFKTDKFTQKDPKYSQIHSEELGVFISFQYIESSKEAYDYAKTHNFLGVEYSEDEVKDYKWNKYDGYSYGIKDNEMYFRILLEQNGDNVIVLSAFVGPKKEGIDFAKVFDSSDFQKFLNTIEFTKENN